MIEEWRIRGRKTKGRKCGIINYLLSHRWKRTLGSARLGIFVSFRLHVRHFRLSLGVTPSPCQKEAIRHLWFTEFERKRLKKKKFSGQTHQRKRERAGTFSLVRSLWWIVVFFLSVNLVEWLCRCGQYSTQSHVYDPSWRGCWLTYIDVHTYIWFRLWSYVHIGSSTRYYRGAFITW